jgi:uncharacterized protein YegJ (DUF2314 family)
MRRAVLLIALLSGCQKKAEPAREIVAPQAEPQPKRELAPAGPLQMKHAMFALGVYHLGKPKQPIRPIATELLRKQGFAVSETFPKEPGEKLLVVMQAPPIAEAKPPGLEELKYRGKGLTPEQQDRLQKADSLTLLTFIVPRAEISRGYRSALSVMLDLARRGDSVIYDPQDRNAYAPAAFERQLGGWTDGVPDVADHVTLDMYRDGELVRIVSMGMEKLGLPDVAVAEVAGHDMESMSGLVILILQTMLERGGIDRPGELDLSLKTLHNAAARKRYNESLKDNAKGVATVHLAIGKAHEGDAENRLLDLVFPGDGSLQTRQSQLLASLFGSHDQLMRANNDDAELQAASRRARAALAKLKPKYSPKPPQLEHLMVKAPFVTRSGDNEWMWVEVVRWEGHKINGILENDPYEVENLKAGARVEVDEDSLFDYIVVHADGSKEGNETSKIIERTSH